MVSNIALIMLLSKNYLFFHKKTHQKNKVIKGLSYMSLDLESLCLLLFLAFSSIHEKHFWIRFFFVFIENVIVARYFFFVICNNTYLVCNFWKLMVIYLGSKFTLKLENRQNKSMINNSICFIIYTYRLCIYIGSLDLASVCIWLLIY